MTSHPDEPSPTLLTTRESMHRIAEHVLSPARYAVAGRIGLRPAPYGVATPPFGPDGRVVALEGLELVVSDSAGERRAPVSTLRAAGEFVGIKPGAPAAVYAPTTPLDPDAPLVLDPAAELLLADWFALGGAALARFAAEIAADSSLASARADAETPLASLRADAETPLASLRADAETPSEATLWPEHFDLAIAAAGVNYGFSAGDSYSPAPYAYVGPHAGPPAGADGFWNAPFGACRRAGQITSVDDAVAFLHEGRRRLHGG